MISKETGRRQQEWSNLCDRVGKLVPSTISEEAWYLVIVRSSPFNVLHVC